ncbi:MAG: DUF5677 domain-containing protein (plasmid) [Candidatus Methanoperedens sp.]|uniref:DUF5677 domain-containing protein n=1 Tax=Candidatus Methanoperedens sp. BLZ2 TaxID=2035255 RepID=UPI000BE2554C|nr:DUF5677 domain-containing protein [Candidatus Methanoperedens sp. BLZ2]MBZ0175609.1 DUF5677 domain-containing protein [Candidatus Methanoperedens nitroreducens]WAH95119.1 MAG: DUF5677 domain-containing protein [Candidatus Methanoperedens sp.]WAM22321.1 MAG: DUF5677 domain-containing protein [Candidatus Methanoperedens sp.]
MTENYTQHEQEYDEIYMILLIYHEKYPIAIKEIDREMLESINLNNPKLTAIINLHWQLFSLSDSVIMMNTKRNYRGASIILRTMMEITLLIQYFDKYPDEARRWIDFQGILMNKVVDKKTYNEYSHLTFEGYEELIKNRGYRDTSHITKEYYKRSLTFDPIFICSNIDYEKYIHGLTNYEQKRNLRNYYNILSNDVHPSFTLFEPLEKDIEVELENLMTALSFTEIVLKIIFNEIRTFIPEKTANEMHLLLLSMLKVLDKNTFDKIIDMLESSDNDKVNIQEIKTKGFIQLPIHNGQKIIHEANCPLPDDLVKEYQTERKQNPKRTNFYFDLAKRYFGLSEKTVYVIDLDINKIEGDENKDLFSVLSAILLNNSILIHTIIDFNNYRKYSESQAILRFIVESAQMVLYFHQHPNEIKRWGDLQQLCIQRSIFNENIKWYAAMDYEGFRSYLQEKKYPKKIFNLINEKNYSSAKWFSPSFIHWQIDYGTLYKEKYMKDVFHELSDIISLHSHPSIATSLYKNERLIDEEIFILSTAYEMYIIMVDVILSRYQKYFPKQKVDDLIEILNTPIKEEKESS